MKSIRHWLTWPSRIVITCLYMAWVAGFLSSSILLLPQFHDFLRDQEGVGSNNPIPVILEIWGFITAVVISIYAVVKGYNWVGEWEWKEDDEDGTDKD